MHPASPSRVCQKATPVFAIAELIVHPMTQAGPAGRVVAELDWPPGRSDLLLCYRVEGDISSLRVPRPADRVQTDGLWQHTCFEMFLRPERSDAYFEFNFSPSGAWAAYGFTSRRSGMRSLEGLAAPHVVCSPSVHRLEARVTLDLATVLDGSTVVDIGLSAVLEDDAGERSCWALAHRSAKPDFHDPDTFALTIAPPGCRREPVP
jgi:hypothetical protein